MGCGGKNARQGCDHESLFHLCNSESRMGPRPSFEETSLRCAARGAGGGAMHRAPTHLFPDQTKCKDGVTDGRFRFPQ
ncbi:hypothetical protein BRPE64_ACDS07600 [Caballeronia insecticola]|uniref:Uncharacterized protein n=1 Tax=Caballeronia insecticola TaxID=758793 RepID=R4WFX0_9BURK|nr:hypothetical protein BRPE64_ACDS07600 [Caballeronia insecticola]